MKNLTFFFLLFLISQNTFAFRIELPGGGEVKGEDPQVVKDTQNVVQKAATETVNGVRDVVAGVANATGVADVLDHNVETIQNLGRIHACMVTLCTSEIIRKQEIEKAEAEAKQKMNLELAAYEQQLNKESSEDNFKRLNLRYERLIKLQGILEEKLKLQNEEIDLIIGLQSVVKAEVEYRDKLKALGAQKTSAPSDITSGAIRFEQEFETDIDTAFVNLESEILRVAQATGRSIARIRTEVFRIVSDQSLVSLMEKTLARSEQIKENRKNVQIEILKNQAEINNLKIYLNLGSKT